MNFGSSGRLLAGHSATANSFRENHTAPLAKLAVKAVILGELSPKSTIPGSSASVAGVLFVRLKL